MTNTNTDTNTSAAIAKPTEQDAARVEAVRIFSDRIDRVASIINEVGSGDDGRHVVRVGQNLYVPTQIGNHLTGIEGAHGIGGEA
jgi:hypothetical protein